MIEHKSLRFSTNPEKAASKVAINSFMIGSLFFILTLVWTLSPEKFGIVIVSELILAIPFLFVSSLAYSKIGYWKETKHWDIFAWYTNNVGNIFVLNVVGLIAGAMYRNIAFTYFALIILLMAIYTSINIFAHKKVYQNVLFKEKLFKFFFFVLVLFLGGIFPLYLKII